MKKLINRLSICVLAIGLSQTLFSQSLNNYWIGTLEGGPMALLIEFKIKGSDTTGYEVSMRSPMQSLKAIPVTKFDIRNDSVAFQITALQMSYNGSVSADRQSINGVLTQAGFKFQLKLQRRQNEFSFVRPQTPTPPYPYTEETLMIPSGDIRLGASLCLPSGDQKSPVVILLTGSGPQNRDEELFSHKPFKVIADALARQGIASLRMDDRGVAHSGGNLNTANYQLLISDVQATLDYLSKHPRINRKKMGLLGHSEGSSIAWLSAESDKRVRFIVLMAGPGIQGSKLLLTQNKAMYEANSSAELAQLRVQMLKPCIDIACSDLEEKSFRILDTIRQLGQDLSEDQRNAIGFSSEASKIIANSLVTPMMIDLLRFDPAQHPLPKKCKILILNGDKDVQVDAQENTDGFRNILTQRKHKNFTIQRLPRLNHLFQNSTTGLTSEYALIEETIDPLVLEQIYSWIHDNS